MTYSELEFKYSKMLMSNIRNVFHPFEFIIVDFSALLKLINGDSIFSVLNTPLITLKCLL